MERIRKMKEERDRKRKDCVWKQTIKGTLPNNGFYRLDPTTQTLCKYFFMKNPTTVYEYIKDDLKYEFGFSKAEEDQVDFPLSDEYFSPEEERIELFKRLASGVYKQVLLYKAKILKFLETDTEWNSVNQDDYLPVT